MAAVKAVCWYHEQSGWVHRAGDRDKDMALERFYLQYFFPPSSVGETGRVGAPGMAPLALKCERG